MNKVLISTLIYLFASTAFASQQPIIWSGGISEEERATAPTTGTRLVFFVKAGSYLADVTVSVRNSAGEEVVNTVVDGPWLILDLDPGSYQVVATTREGQVQSLVITVTESAREFGFAFPES